MKKLTTESLQEWLKEFAQLTSPAERRQAFFRLHQLLPEADDAVVDALRPLLRDWDFEIRREVAYWLESRDLLQGKKDRHILAYALQQFDLLKFHSNDPEARAFLLAALTDRNPRVREKVLRIFHLNDCADNREILHYWYGRGDYVRLLQFAREHDLIEEAKALLRRGMAAESNIPYHQRQCAMALQQLGEEVSIPKTTDVDEPPPKTADEPIQRQSQTPLDLFLERLHRRGLRTNSGIIYPHIHVGSITGRITYKNPPVQTWSPEKKAATLEPPAGFRFWRFDFREIEPRLLLHYLVQFFWLALSDIPSGDIYEWTGLPDRRQAKRLLNRIINGGHVPAWELPSPSFRKFLEALEEFRLELMEMVRQDGHVTTLGGRKIPIKPSDPKFHRRVMNYLIQGSAADFFNEGMIALEGFLTLENLPAEITLLVFDEVWLAVASEQVEQIVPNVESFLNSLWKRFNLFVSIQVKSHSVERSK